MILRIIYKSTITILSYFRLYLEFTITIFKLNNR